MAIHKLPELPYSYDALEPYIDAETMEIHHTKHHGTYVTKLNDALQKVPRLADASIETLMTELSSVPEEVQTAVRNNGGGHFNHSLFWQLMGPSQGGKPVGELAQAIDKELGGVAAFKEAFTAAALGRFGSGWAWLSLDRNGELLVSSTPNQDTPLMDGYRPVLGLDVWEHAYYLKYQNRRPDYVEAWWNVVDWEAVEERYRSMRRGM
jgi:Fe-Mn family superoxide dismutase